MDEREIKQAQRVIDSMLAGEPVGPLEAAFPAAETDEREAFEEWAKTRQFSLKKPAGVEGYPAATTQAAWLSWQAAVRWVTDKDLAICDWYLQAHPGPESSWHKCAGSIRQDILRARGWEEAKK